MTDNEIKKALEHYSKDAFALYYFMSSVTLKHFLADVFDLINRQQAEIADERAKGNICAEVIARQDKEIAKYKAEIKNYSRNNRSLTGAVTEMQKALKKRSAEIEKLRAECWNQSVLWNKHFEGIFETAKETIKAEAVKEFAEKLKQEVEMISYEMCSNYQDTIDAIDEAYKEMVGE